MMSRNEALDGRDSPQRSGGERSEPPRSGGEDRPSRPDSSTEVSPSPQRRRFSNSYKLRIVRAADACKRPGEIGELLRREGLYSSHLTIWRRLRDSGALLDTAARKRGPAPVLPNPLQAEVVRLQQTVDTLRAQLAQAQAIIDVQKKIADLLQTPLPNASPTGFRS